MKFVYEVPPHLEAYLGGMDVKALKQLTTNLYEMAVNHRLIDHPKLHIEKQVDDLVNSVALLLSQNDKIVRTLTEEIGSLKRSVSEMSSQRIDASLSPRSTIIQNVEYLEDGGEEEFFVDLKESKNFSQDFVTSNDDDVQDLVDELLA